MKQFDVIIVGGGLAGLTAALELSGSAKNVLVIEKSSYPCHKVCGEYVSMEVVPYLESLGIDLNDAVRINKMEISNKKGRILKTSLPLGGIGISRYELDYRLYQKALAQGVAFIFGTVTNIEFRDPGFKITTALEEVLSAEVVIGAFGKRSNLDKTLNRKYMERRAPWLGVKAHYNYSDFPDDLVGVHSFDGGYGGLSKTETGAVNFCYLANYRSFKKYADINAFNQKVVSQNPHLKALFNKADLLFSKPLSIAQISFEKKLQVEDHIIMCGDASGLIHPLCGNGMAMAIHSALLASALIKSYLEDIDFSREQLEQTYTSQWNKNFGQRLWWGRQLQSLIMNNFMSDLVLRGFAISDRLTGVIIRKTHGKPIEIS
ncbi:MAG: NAD(P)/FAD-dependent oxidoreductase [Flavobacteriaceae bacterium]